MGWPAESLVPIPTSQQVKTEFPTLSPLTSMIPSNCHQKDLLRRRKEVLLSKSITDVLQLSASCGLSLRTVSKDLFLFFRELFSIMMARLWLPSLPTTLDKLGDSSKQ